jgi:SAM-dependent methyltransferase
MTTPEIVDGLIGTTHELPIDLTKNFDYQKLVVEEVEHYCTIEITDGLTEGGNHAYNSWDYWFGYLEREVNHTSLRNEVLTFANSIDNPRILSLGCGYGGVELSFARALRRPFELIGVDLNPRLFARVEKIAADEGLPMRVQPADLNFVTLRPESFDLIFAHAAIHHALNLEHLFDQVRRALRPGGRFIVQDIIGRSQVLFWRENHEHAARLVDRLPLRYRRDHQAGIRGWLPGRSLRLEPYIEPAEQHGMEGIRQEDIEREILARFEPVKLFKYGAFMRLICTHPIIGKRLDPTERRAHRVLDSLCEEDVRAVASGRLRPTELLGVFVPKAGAPAM